MREFKEKPQPSSWIKLSLNPPKKQNDPQWDQFLNKLRQTKGKKFIDGLMLLADQFINGKISGNKDIENIDYFYRILAKNQFLLFMEWMLIRVCLFASQQDMYYWKDPYGNFTMQDYLKEFLNEGSIKRFKNMEMCLALRHSEQRPLALEHPGFEPALISKKLETLAYKITLWTQMRAAYDRRKRIALKEKPKNVDMTEKDRPNVNASCAP